MKQQEGKFILFDLTGFAEWLNVFELNREIKLIQDHHTWSPSYANFDGTNHFALLRGMEQSHLERGFAEIAQNLTTFPDGTVAVCRSFEKDPAGIKGANTGALCIENLGNFDLGQDRISTAHQNCIIELNALLCRKFRLPPDSSTIVYHHWFDLSTGRRTNGTGNTKTCPGTNFFGGNQVADAETKFIPLIARKIARWITITPTAAGAVIFSGRVTAERLNVRNEPQRTGKIIKELTKDAVIQAYELQGSWCRIDPVESQWVNTRLIERIRTRAG